MTVGILGINAIAEHVDFPSSLWTPERGTRLGAVIAVVSFLLLGGGFYYAGMRAAGASGARFWERRMKLFGYAGLGGGTVLIGRYCWLTLCHLWHLIF